MDYAKNNQHEAAPTLLVVEDHPATRTMLVDWLGTTFPNYQCLGAGSGEEALELVRTLSPALVVMDFALPGVNGIEATRQIKHLTPRVRVILLSMYEAEVYQTEATAAGASAYLFKRTMYTDLIPTLQALLAPFGNAPSAGAGLE
jgi:two-component system, NarL family, invasion response regulator UvrY